MCIPKPPNLPANVMQMPSINNHVREGMCRDCITRINVRTGIVHVKGEQEQLRFIGSVHGEKLKND